MPTGTVRTLSNETTQLWSSPLPGPTATSLDNPLMVPVMGATVTLVIAPRAASRVRTSAGRVLSRRTKQISLTGSVLDPNVGAGPRHEVVKIVRRTLGAKYPNVVLCDQPAHLSFQCRRD